MIFSITGIIYLIAAIFIAVLIHRTRIIFQKEKSAFLKNFLISLIFVCFNFLITSVASLFFVNSPLILKGAVYSAVLLQSLIAIFLVQALYPIKFPDIPLKIVQGFIILLTLIIEFLYYRSVTLPFLEPNNFINWNVDPLIGPIRALIMIIFLGPALIIFSEKIKDTDKEVRKKSIIFLVLGLIGLAILFLFFIIFQGTGFAELIPLILIILLFGFLTFSQKK